MAKTGLINRLGQRFIDERAGYLLEEQTPTRLSRYQTQSEMVKIVNDIAHSKDVGQILQIERSFILNDLEHYANSAAMRGSLYKALNEVTAAQTTYQKVLDPAQYKEIDQGYQSHKSRTGDLPNDEARQFFKGNNARLLNMDKSRLDPSEKEILDARRAAMRSGEKAYIDLQRQALRQEQNKTDTLNFSH